MTEKDNNLVSTPDLCDAYPEQVRVLDSVFNDYGGVTSFFGQVVTIKCFEDNSVVKQLVSTPGEGRVIVMDGGGSLRRAILGDMLAAQAADNGWAGLVINGCIRDCLEIAETAVGVKALNTHPMKTEKRGLGDLDVPVTFAGQTIMPGDWLYADQNGVLVCDQALSFD
ncbi:ribonuclease E activity regulator RraA [Arenicella xantha]|uniref:4-hydroxy-4-methyl-2-oxoglutarate aldolase n=1 Tax=Arenicella xantha TaxID=644221 RepID=A0A395JLZ9_9GAMM|nr:ribonuclease E activity regulator RraA [Arenicella xantha]RBP50877.1 regulator of ribonuclease activity A [Arenicella xantha]